MSAPRHGPDADPLDLPAASDIPGVRWLRVARHVDARGSFREVWRESALGAVAGRDASLAEWLAQDRTAGTPLTLPNDSTAQRFLQANLSISATGVLRGLHLHRRQLDAWTFLAGRAFVALVDLRPMLLDDWARPLVEVRLAGVDDQVVVPAGVAHGFLALEELQLLYLVTGEYDGTDEIGLAWDDPTVGVPWPTPASPDERPILSDRDRENPRLAGLVDLLRRQR